MISRKKLKIGSVLLVGAASLGACKRVIADGGESRDGSSPEKKGVVGESNGGGFIGEMDDGHARLELPSIGVPREETEGSPVVEREALGGSLSTGGTAAR